MARVVLFVLIAACATPPRSDSSVEQAVFCSNYATCGYNCAADQNGLTISCIGFDNCAAACGDVDAQCPTSISPEVGDQDWLRCNLRCSRDLPGVSGIRFTRCVSDCLNRTFHVCVTDETPR